MIYYVQPFLPRELYMNTPVEELIGKEMTQIFQGLRPGLVLDLADLDGSTIDDLNVSLQIMPFGDRATLAAYELVAIDGRKPTALPKLVEATRAAAVSRQYWEQ